MVDYTAEYQDIVAAYWETYIGEGKPIPDKVRDIRPVILESWKRAKKQKVPPMEVKDEKLEPDALLRVRARKHELISVAHPYLQNLYSYVKGSNFIIALTDEKGNVIDLIGNDAMIQARAKKSGLTLGCNRSEKYAGTNGIGTCLVTGQPIQIWGCEHYIKPHHSYVCSAAPIKNEYGTIRGCVDLIGPMEAISPHTLGMVCAAVDGIQKEMMMRQAYEKISLINNQLNITVQSIASGIILFDNIGIITQYNNRAAEILKLPYDHLNHKNIANILDLKTSTVNALEVSKNLTNKEVSVTNVLGIKLNLSISASIIYNDSQEKIGTLLIFDELQRLHTMVSKMSGFSAKYTFESIIGNSPGINEVKALGLIAAQGDSNVLILGESGTGKELLAQSIHNASNRSSGPFIAINCGSLPKGLIESELFGYEGGAFTGANKEGNPGKFELAHGGTIFLDEIGDMPLEMQSSLLRVIQTKEIVRIGGKNPKQIDVRIMAATNVDLVESIKNKGFRSDLYYRLGVLIFSIPALRDRPGDVIHLANFFVNAYNRSMSKNIAGFTPEAEELIKAYDWPGNVREMENVIERAFNLTSNEYISVEDLTPEIRNKKKHRFAGVEDDWAQDKTEAPMMKEYDVIVNALKRAEGNVGTAAALAGIPRRTFYRKIEKYKLDARSFRPW